MNIFNTVYQKKKQRNFFDQSHDLKYSFKIGQMIPFYVDDIVPNDTKNLSSSHIIRMAPLASPVMHNVNAYQYYFWVPYRLLWDNFHNFISGGEDGVQNPEFPYYRPFQGHPTKGIRSIGDYMGLPTGDNSLEGNEKVSAMYISALNFIYNEYFRDQNLEEPINYKLVDGDQTLNPNPLKYTYDSNPFDANYRHDYFTSALPFAQKGPAVTIPLGQSADVVFDADGTGRDNVVYNKSTKEPFSTADNLDFDDDGRLLAGATTPALLDNSDNLKVDLTTATSTTINELRRAFRLQEWLEANARGGSRYSEFIWNMFGRRTSDATLQRPEYLAGGKSSVIFGEVTQTSQSTDMTSLDQTPLGTMGGRGISQGKSKVVKKNFEEYGCIIGLIAVKPEPVYMQGLPKKFFRFDRFDYPFEQFANIGEEPIINKELYYKASDPNNQDTFGYTPRYATWKTAQSRVAGDMRQSLDYWHMTRKFENRPTLQEEFIKMKPDDFERIFTVGSIPQTSEQSGEIEAFDTLYCHTFFNDTVVRTLPRFGIPKI